MFAKIKKATLMILIADSGSTKCSWAVCDTNGNLIKECNTIGFNPYFISSVSILEHLRDSDLNDIRNDITSIFFYAAGCSSKEKNKIIETPFKDFFSHAKITISHDLDAACFALYNNSPNITCILGTGSNSCTYDGNKITENAPSLGFIVGDEASGNNFGKKILSLYFNKILPEELNTIFEEKYETDISVINKNIYNNNRANVFLAQYFPFITETKNHKLIQKLIQDTLDEFINLHIKCFSNYNSVDVNFIGSVSFFLSDEIHEAAKRHNFKVGNIIKNPIKKLIDYHCKKLQEEQVSISK